MAFVTTLKSGAGEQIDEIGMRLRQKKVRIVVLVEAPPEARIGTESRESNSSPNEEVAK